MTAPGQEPYRVQLTTLVSNLAIPRVQPDCQIDVRVDPQAPTSVVIDPAAGEAEVFYRDAGAGYADRLAALAAWRREHAGP